MTKALAYLALLLLAFLMGLAGPVFVGSAAAQTFQSDGCSNSCVVTDAGSGGTKTLTGTLPASTASGHTLVAEVVESVCNDTYTTTGPAGWSQVGSAVQADDGGGDNMQTTIWTIVASGASPPADWTQSAGGTCDFYLIHMADYGTAGTITPSDTTTSGAVSVATLNSASLTPSTGTSTLLTFFQSFSFGDIASVTGSPSLTQRWLDAVGSTGFMADYMGDLAISGMSPTSVYAVNNTGTDLMTSESLLINSTTVATPTPGATATPTVTPAPTQSPVATPTPLTCLAPGQTLLFNPAPAKLGFPPIPGFNTGANSTEAYTPNLPGCDSTDLTTCAFGSGPTLNPINAGDRIMVFLAVRGSAIPTTDLPTIHAPNGFSLISTQTVIPSAAPTQWLIFNIYQYIVPAGGALPPYTVNNCGGTPCLTMNSGWTMANSFHLPQATDWSGTIQNEINGYPLLVQQTENSGTSLVSNLTFPGYGFGSSVISFDHPTAAAGELFGIESITGAAITMWAVASNDGLALDVAPASVEGTDLSTSLYSSGIWLNTAWQSSSNFDVYPVDTAPGVNGLFQTGTCHLSLFPVTATATPTPAATATPTATPTAVPITSAAGIDVLLKPCATEVPCIQGSMAIGDNSAPQQRTQILAPQVPGQQVGDLLIASIMMGNPKQNITSDGHWNPILQLNSPSYGSNTQALFWKIVTHREPKDGWYFLGSIGENWSSAIIVDVGCVDTQAPIDVSNSFATDLAYYGNPPGVLYNITQMTATVPQITTTQTGDAALVFCGSAEHNYFAPPSQTLPDGLSYITDWHGYASQVALLNTPSDFGQVGPFTINAAHIADIKCSIVALAGK